MITASELVSGSIRLVSLPQIYLKVKQIVEDDDASLNDLAKYIAYDPALTAQLLRTANCALWAPRYRIETVSRALEVLGMNHVHDLILATVVTSIFKGLDTSHINLEKFWKKSVFSGLAASALGKRCELIDVQRPFVEGLLSDIGHMIMYHSVPDMSLKAYELANGNVDKLVEFERELIGCDFAQVGAELTTEWQLPACFSATIGNQNHPILSSSHAFESSIVHIATRLANKEFDTKGVDLADIIDRSAWPLTGLTEDCLPDVENEVQQSMATTIQMFM